MSVPIIPNLPKEYRWLLKIDTPKFIDEALKLYGVKEIVGSTHNKEILGWARELGLEKVYTNDEIAWCGLLTAIVVKRTGREVVKDPLWARNWLKFGVASKTPELGDILVFSRGTGGHVGFYIGEDDTCYHVLGGNQSNEVSITRVLKSRLLGARRPVYKRKPSTSKIYLLSSEGRISTNEA